MYNIFFKILIFVLILSTLAVLGLKPKMHNKVLVYDSAYRIVETVPDVQKDTVIPQMEQTVTSKNTVSKVRYFISKV